MTVSINGSEVNNLAFGAAAIRRLSLVGYGNSRVTPLTTVASLLADLDTFAALIPADSRQIVETAANWVQWAATEGILTTGIVTALTTVADETVSATTDLLFCFRGHADFPTAFDLPTKFKDITVSLPNL